MFVRSFSVGCGAAYQWLPPPQREVSLPSSSVIDCHGLLEMSGPLGGALPRSMTT